MIDTEIDFWIFVALVFGSTLALGLMLGYWIGEEVGRKRTTKQFLDGQIEARRAEVAERALARLRRARKEAVDVLEAEVIQ